MIKVFAILKDRGGCSYHRIIMPLERLNETSEEVHVDFDIPENVKDTNGLIDFLREYDAVIFSRYTNSDFIHLLRARAPKIKVIMDIDDYWELDTNHIQYDQMKEGNVSKETKKLFKLVDAVFTTTDKLARKIKPFNNNVYVLPNALRNEGQFKRPEHKSKSNRVRIGMVGGISHYTDIELLRGVVNGLPKDVMDKVQFVLCGFDKGYIKFDDGTRIEAPWEENKWNKLESILTDNYKTVSEKHYNALMRYNYGINYEFDEPYKRVWALKPDKYATFYDDVDVLIAPLFKTNFNECKSELKLVEASVKGIPAIVSDCSPYTICGRNVFLREGKIDTDGNCIMVDERKRAKGWIKAITKIVRDGELREMIARNLSKLTEEGGPYNLDTINKKREEIFREICNM